MQEIVTQEASPKRAMEALEWAVQRAEKAEVEPSGAASELRPSPRVISGRPADFKAAASLYLPDVRKLLDRIMMSEDAESGLDALLESGALAAMLPEVEAMVGFGDGEWRHKDVWKHTKQVVRQAVPRLEVRWAALLHDIGKTRTRSISPTGEVHFFGHAEVGARMFDKIDRRLPLFAKEAPLKSSIRFLILHHLRASQYDPSWTDSAVRRFAKEMGGCLTDVLDLSRADITTKRPEKKRKGLKQISELAERVLKIQEEDAVVPPLPSGIGDAIMQAFGIPPSRRIGELKRALEEAIDSGEVASHQESEVYLAFLRDNAARFGL
ncbi:HDIG domain-containing metalloprotein [Sorangium sp. So ce131]|uniref:HDIG domain-containing metalloprotein n=1 Tax=Sorangium sp. So ce131 TaxID=3133282 RepID=UPI003F613C4A